MENNKDRKNIIINVGRQIGSGGHTVAKRLAGIFDCQFYDKELLCLVAKETGFSERFFEKNDEQKSLFDSLFSMHSPFVGDVNFYGNNFSQEGLFKMQSDVIRATAADHSSVFVGRCADYILRDYEGVLNIFITADLSERIAEISRRRNCTADEAEEFIAKGEKERASYYNFYTGKKWGHSASYDLCVNVSRLGLDATVDMITTYARRYFGK